jgi:hypothetical protein
MELEKYVKWEPIKNIPETLYLEGLHDDYEGFRLLLRDEKLSRMLRITFDPPLSYRNTDEGDLLKTDQIAEGFLKWPLYTVENSRFLKWFHEESLEIHRNENPIHYAIITPNDVVDIISCYPPKVEWLTDEEAKDG